MILNFEKDAAQLFIEVGETTVLHVFSDLNHFTSGSAMIGNTEYNKELIDL